ncbi:MAG TPA: hypothetical protein DD716_05120 [Thiomicrospira sp.]|nr:hypothetical protein [Thiomicrospira sp.]
MKLKLVSIFIVTIALAGCGGEGVKQDVDPVVQVTPDWTTKGVSDTSGYNSVITVATKEDLNKASSIGSAEVLALLKADLNNLRQEKMQQINSQHTGIEKAIRSKALAELPFVRLPEPIVVETFENPITGKISVWTQLNKADLVTHFKGLLSSTDAHLANYIHPSTKGDNLTQAIAILPALPTLLSRQELIDYINYFSKEEQNIELKNDQLANLLNLNLTNRLSSTIIALSASANESEQFEPKLQAEMEKQGFNF